MGVVFAAGSSQSSSVEVLDVLRCRSAVSVPSCMAPNVRRCTVSGRPPTGPNICRRVRTSFTGRPTCRAAIAERITCDHADPLQPNPPPRKYETTRTFSFGSWNAFATVVARPEHALRRIVEREVIPFPHRERCVRLHRIVLLERRGVRVVDAHCRGREPRGHIAAPRPGSLLLARLASVTRGRRHDRRFGDVERWRFDIVGEADEVCRLRRVLQRIGHDEPDRLAVVVDAIVLQHGELAPGWRLLERLVRDWQSRRVARSEHREHAGHPFGGPRVGAPHAAARDRARHHHRVDCAGHRHLGRVTCATGHLQAAIDAVEWRADAGRGCSAFP